MSELTCEGPGTQVNSTYNFSLIDKPVEDMSTVRSVYFSSDREQ